MNELNFTVEKAEDGLLLREFLYMKGLSKTLVKKAKLGGLFVLGESVTVRRILSEGETVRVLLPDVRSEGIPPIAIPLKIVYEDDYLILVDKPSNMPTHPSKGNSLPTLANAIMARYGEDFTFRAVNRLDRDTSGLVLIAKDAFCANTLASSMKKGEFIKKYLARVLGRPTPSSGIIDLPIKRESEASLKRIVADDGKPAKTEYKVIKEEGNCSLLEIRLFTGRTHQIRVHMAHIGTPLLGDFLYGREDSGAYFLRCHSLSFPHPITKEILTFKID